MLKIGKIEVKLQIISPNAQHKSPTLSTNEAKSYHNQNILNPDQKLKNKIL